MVPRLLGLWLLLLCAAGGLRGAEIAVSAECPWTDRDGYTPVQVTIRAEVSTTVEVEGTMADNRATLSVAVPAGAVVRRTLLLPGNANRYDSGITLRWTASGLPWDNLSVSPRGHREFDVVVLDPDETLPLKDLRAAVVATLPAPPSGSYSSSTSTYNDERFNRWAVGAVPDRWQGIPAWATVLSTPAGDRALDPGQRAALAAWTHAGGRLFVTSPAQVAGWRALGARVEVGGNDALRARIREVWHAHERGMQTPPVPGTGRVPVYGFVGIALLFAVIVGPLNLWWCARTGRRHLLLLTTPLVSVAASALLLAYGLLSDGLGVQRSVVQVLALDQAGGRAGTWTAVSYFAGLSPGTLALDGDALITAQQQQDEDLRYRRDRGDVPPVALAWPDGGQLASGWIPARINRHLTVAGVLPEKRRLVLTAAGAGWTVTNGFDHELAALQWTDAAGKSWHLGGTLAPGAGGPLTEGAPAGDSPAATLPLARLPPAVGGSPVGAITPGVVPPGMWVAEFAGALLPVPGPAAADAAPPRSWVVGSTGGR